MPTEKRGNVQKKNVYLYKFITKITYFIVPLYCYFFAWFPGKERLFKSTLIESTVYTHIDMHVYISHDV